MVKRDGVVVSNQTVTVECDSEDPQVTVAEVQLVNACRNGLGYLLFQFANPTSAERTYIIEFANLNNRSNKTQPHGAGVRAVTGRPSGTYDYLVRVGSTTVTEGQVTTDCSN